MILLITTIILTLISIIFIVFAFWRDSCGHEMETMIIILSYLTGIAFAGIAFIFWIIVLLCKIFCE